MQFRLLFTDQAVQDYQDLKKDKGLTRHTKAVQKAFALLETNPRHTSLNTHEFTSLSRTIGKKVFEAYAENKTSSAYRIVWQYGPKQKEITIISIVPHP